MPKNVERQLWRQAEKQGLQGRRKQAYVYGTLHRIERNEKRKQPKAGRKK